MDFLFVGTSLFSTKIQKLHNGNSDDLSMNHCANQILAMILTGGLLKS